MARTAPVESIDIVKSMILDGQQGGLLPKWSHQNQEAFVMTGDPETLGIDDNVSFALNRMILGGFRHIPVTDEAGRAVGVLSQREIVAFVVSLLPNRVLNLPPEPHLQAHSEDGG